MTEKLSYKIIHNEPHGQWEIQVAPDNRVIGYLSYDLNDTEIFFTSTVVRREYQGQGLATELVRTAFEAVKAEGKRKIVPICSFVQKFATQNPGYPIAAE